MKILLTFHGSFRLNRHVAKSNKADDQLKMLKNDLLL